MTKRDNTKVLWRVQVRKSRGHKWVNKGLYETRGAARYHAGWLRYWGTIGKTGLVTGHYGFGNTRVIRYERAAQVVEVAK